MIAVDRVSHGYGPAARRTEILHGVGLDVAPGEVVALSGPSGSGKSTLCHLVAGFERPDRGSVTVAGTPVCESADWSLVAAVPQQVGLLPELSIRDNIGLPALRASAALAPGTVPALLAALDLERLADRSARDASLGEQQRTSVARALLLSPRALVLDEPTAHQDDDRLEQVLEAVVAAARAGTAVLVASHDDRVLRAADRVVRLDEGRVLSPAR